MATRWRWVRVTSACGASTRPSWRKRAPINSGFAITASRGARLAGRVPARPAYQVRDEKDRQLWPRHRDLPNDKRSGRCPGHRPCRLCRRVHALYRPVQGRRDPRPVRKGRDLAGKVHAAGAVPAPGGGLIWTGSRIQHDKKNPRHGRHPCRGFHFGRLRPR